MSRPSSAAPRSSSSGSADPRPDRQDTRSSITEIHPTEETPLPGSASGPLMGASRQEAQELAAALHEVSNALTVVLGWLDAASESERPDEVRSALLVAREHARRGRHLARYAIGGEDEPLSESRGAGGLAQFAMTSVQPRAALREVRLEVGSLPDPEIALRSEEPALQILTNLLLNAIDFSPADGTIRLGITSDRENVVFSVSDEGPGIPEERRSSLFVEPVSTRRGGAGIGLTHSRKLARDYGGELRLAPSEVGARFELVWPRAGTPTLRPSCAEQLGMTAIAGARVLVVEDDPAIASLLELSLEARGAQVLIADGAEGLARVLAGRPVIDVALLDLSPLKGRLDEWIQEIQAHAPTAPLLLVSGHPNGIPEEAEGRFSAWVRKPFEMSELLLTLNTLLSEREPG